MRTPKHCNIFAIPFRYYLTTAYNIQGWITSQTARHGNSTLFTHNLRYYDPSKGTAAVYNGNISEWSAQHGTNQMSTYGFTYDNLGRLTGSISYLDYGARMYEPLIGRWGTVDPMEKKYYNLTPYNYCGNNPVKFVDKDGRDYGLKVDKKNRVIIINAVYVTNKISKASLEKAINFYNSRKGDSYFYDKEKYSVRFNLTMKIVANPKRYTENRERAYDNYNSYMIGTPIDNTKDEFETVGVTEGKRYITVSKTKSYETTGAHEIGHSLNLTPEGEHSEIGIMTPHATDSNRNCNITQKNINNMIDSKLNKSLPSLKEIFKSIKDKF